MSEEKVIFVEENPQWIPKEKHLGEFVLSCLKLHKEKIAMINAETEESITYEKLLKNVTSVAETMKKLGVTKNDVISICSKNSLENYVSILASFLIGVKSASLDPSLSLGETIHLINLTRPKLIFCDQDSLLLIEQAIEQIKNTKIVVFGCSDKYLNFNSFLNCKTNENFKVDYNDDNTAIIIFSSGSTGLPKGICLSHYGILYQTLVVGRAKKCMKGCIIFNTSYWISSILHCLSTFAKGGIFILTSNFEVEKCLKYIEKYKIVTTAISTTMSQYFLQNPELCRKYDISSLDFMSVAGENCTETHLKELQILFSRTCVVNVYGMTEICGPAFYYDWENDLKMRNKKGNSPGKPIPGFQMKVVDLNTQKQLNKYETGELRIKTKTIMTGYYENKKEYEQQFDDEGYYCTGDVVYFDEDNCFYIVDRIKEMLKFRSWHVTPVSIESVLLTHPSIREVIVFGIPHKTDGEHPMAIIVFKDDHFATSDDIIQYVEERVPDRYKLRGGVKFLKSLPKTPSGKMRRMVLRKMILNENI